MMYCCAQVSVGLLPQLEIEAITYHAVQLVCHRGRVIDKSVREEASPSCIHAQFSTPPLQQSMR